MRLVFAPVLVIAAGLAGAALADALPVSAPEAHGFDSGRLAEVLLAARASGEPLHGLSILRGGDVLLDARFYPYDGTLHDMASVTKSVTTSLVAIAAGEGLLDLDAPMLSFFPDRAIANIDARKARISVRHLTENLSGLACIGAPEEVTLAQMAASADFVQFALDLPMAHEPGTHFDYCSPGMHILSAIVQQATGMTEAAFAEKHLFAPLGITGAVWDSDPQGVTRGWGDLHLTPPDMARIGLMWLAGGAWEGRQVIPADWLAAATTAAHVSDRYEDYGAGFWIGPRATEPVPYFMASGRGGQRIVVAPALDLVIVTLAGGADTGALIDAVVPALLDPGGALPANPEGEARLAEALAAVGAPPRAMPVPAPPPMAAAASGRTYDLEPNPFGLASARLDFAGGAEAALSLGEAQGLTKRPVGLDGVYRWSAGPSGVRYGLAAGWTDAATLVVDYNTIGDIRAYTITLHFSDDAATMNMRIEQRDEPTTVTLAGTAR